MGDPILLSQPGVRNRDLYRDATSKVVFGDLIPRAVAPAPSRQQPKHRNLSLLLGLLGAVGHEVRLSDRKYFFLFGNKITSTFVLI